VTRPLYHILSPYAVRMIWKGWAWWSVRGFGHYHPNRIKTTYGGILEDGEKRDLEILEGLAGGVEHDGHEGADGEPLADVLLVEGTVGDETGQGRDLKDEGTGGGLDSEHEEGRVELERGHDRLVQ
jgi:hypothetical protein